MVSFISSWLWPWSESELDEPQLQERAAETKAEGVELLRSGRYQEAVEQLQAAARLEPHSVQILSDLGLAHARMEDFDAASECYEQALALDGTDAETLFALAWVERKRRRAKRAAELLQRVLVLRPGQVKALHTLGDLARDEGDYGEAVRFYEEVVRRDPSGIGGSLRLAQCCEHLGQYKRAEQLYREVTKLAPECLHAVLSLGRVNFTLSQHMQCKLYSDRIPDSYVHAFEARLCSARACRELGDHKQARAYAERAVQLRSDPEAMYFLGEEYRQASDDVRAKQWFLQALQADPDHIPSHLDLGHMLHEQSQYREAAAHLQRVHELAPSNVEALIGIAQTEFALEEYDACEHHCLQAVELHPLSLDAFWLLAETHMRSSGEASWVEEVSTALEIPAADVCSRVAVSYLVRQQTGEALTWLRLARQRDPDDARLQRAIDLMKSPSIVKAPQVAIAALEHIWKAAAPAGSTDLKPLFHALAKDYSMSNLGRSTEKDMSAQSTSSAPSARGRSEEEPTLQAARQALEAGDLLRARTLAERAVQLSPGDFGALFCLGRVSARLGHEEEALRHLQKCLDIRPSDAASMLELAEVLRRVGRKQDAIKWFEHVLDLRPGDVDCCLSLAQLNASMGSAGVNKALGYMQMTLQGLHQSESARRHEIFLQMAGLQCSIQAWEEAHATLTEAAVQFPRDAEIQAKLSKVSQQLRDRKALSTDQVQERGQEQGQAKEVAATSIVEKIGMLTKSGSELQAHDLAPGEVEFLRGATVRHLEAGNLEEAYRNCSAWARCCSQDTSAKLQLGDICFRQGKLRECEQLLSTMLCLDLSQEDASLELDARRLLIQCYLAFDEPDLAERHVLAALGLASCDPALLRMLALAQQRAGSYDEAVSVLRQVMDFYNANSSSSAGMGGGGAITALEFAELRAALAEALERQGDWPAAMEEARTALTMQPRHLRAMMVCGMVHLQLQQLEEAENSLQQVLGIAPAYVPALVRLGCCRLLKNDHQGASKLLEEALRHFVCTAEQPESLAGSAHVYCALAQLGQQDIKGALAQLAAAKKRHRNLRQVSQTAPESIVEGACEGLIDSLLAIGDLDINTAQAWQLVHLLAKELEYSLQDPQSPAAVAFSSPLRSEEPAQGDHPPKGGPSAAFSPGKFRSTPATAGGGAAVSRSRQRLAPQPMRGASVTNGLAPRGAPTPSSRQRDALVEGERLLPAVVRRLQAQHGPSAASRRLLQGLAQLQAHALEPRQRISDDDLVQEAESLGSGGFGVVYRGWLRGEVVAIKRFTGADGGASPAQLEELITEVSTLRDIRHPRIVRFHGAGLEVPNLCVVTEFMPGGSLYHALHEERSLPASRQQEVSCQIVEGVDFLHSRRPKVVHRDLKSLNILLDLEYNAKICDFGLTTLMERNSISLEDVGSGGSPRYLAPECYDSVGVVTEKVDVWALGCLLIEVFGGPLPFDQCASIQEIVTKVLIERETPFVPGFLPPTLASIAKDCFVFDPALRTSSRDVYLTLQSLGTEDPVAN